MKYHDWEIVGINSDRRSRTLELVLVSETGERNVFKALGCNYYRVTDYIWQNVVFDFIEVSPNIEASELLKKLNWLSLEEDVSSGEISMTVERLVQAVVSGSLKILHFSPSFGADILILCEDFAIN